MVTGYGGTYRGVVVDDADPLQQHRLGVVVPDVYGDGVSVWAVPLQENRLELIVAGVDSTPMWATASDDVRYGDIPEIDAEVWVEFEYGDPAYPRWVGVA